MRQAKNQTLNWFELLVADSH